MKKFICMAVAVSLLSACATDPYTGESKVAKTTWGTGIGTAVGAGIGALAGGKKGALIGAGVGALAGAGTGGYMDYQAAKLRQELVGTGVQVKEVNGQIYLVMPGNITFDTNEAFIKSSFQPVVTSIAKVLTEYDKTLVYVNGYTDNTGTDAINNPLSQKRANAVADFLRVKGVAATRLKATGLGSSNPIADNKTAAGRELNRRVEIVLVNMQ
ncbi:MAG: OmpA family protein [Alphaproteobacteria bacterium]|nr:OmpA family protein [Alphaproteobacteria bacterium]